MYRYRAIAVDYDGTLTSSPHPSEEVLAALHEFRAEGGTIVLCTGRILDELRAVFPDVERHADAIVGENGAVLWTPAGERLLSPAVDVELELELRRQGIPLRRGRVLLATQGIATEAASAAITRLGLGEQLVHNRGELMVLPAGVSKGTGLMEALGELRISHHSTAGVGDAENDHALLDVCELGVAVANAVPSLQRRADVVLGEADGAGVVEFLRGPIVRGEVVVHPERWRLDIGVTDDGEPVTLPGSDVDVLIVGSTGSGKSHLAGLVIERAVLQGYSVCVIDPEGDHSDLARLRGVLHLGGGERPPEPADVARLLRHRFTSLVIDLSLMDPAAQMEYWRTLAPVLDQVRVDTGAPHWIVLEEADRLLAGRPLSRLDPRRPASGFCLVTYHPDALAPEVLDEVDSVLALRGAEYWARMPLRDASGMFPTMDPARAFTWKLGTAVLADGRTTRAFTPAARATRHVRHWHKYVHGRVARPLRFFFRNGAGLSGRTAANIAELHRELGHASASVLAHHIESGDLSRWLQEVIRDDVLAEDTRAVERWAQGEATPDVEVARRALLRLIETRYEEFDASLPQGSGAH